jgi:Cdc6-like AAA superfamily ATPase
VEDDRRYLYIAKISQAFTPGAPIDSKDLFAGRKRQREKLISTIFQKGEHAILYGERGVGKTSLANTLFDFLVIMGKYSYYRAKVNCADHLSFEDIWRSIFKQLVFTDGDGNSSTVDEALPENPNSENIRETFQIFRDPSIIIIDELDKITDRLVLRKLADTVKTLSDNAIDATLILVGVGDSIEQLFGEHRSIERAIVQVPMKRMAKAELLEIIDKGLSKCDGMTIENAAKERIADYSQGLPFYTHLLARESALQAVRSDRTQIDMSDLKEAIEEAVNTQLETNLTEYNKAVSAPRGKNFKPVLLACALAPKNEQQWFYAKDVVKPVRLITSKSYDVPAFAKHLKAFCERERGSILERRGPPRKVQYRFVRPLMEPYVVLRGLADGLIAEAQLSRPSQNSSVPEQLSLLSPDAAQEIDI